MARFPEVSPDLDLPALDREVLALWRERKVFQRSVEQRAGAEPYVFYEGPPTANGRPGVHHVEARVFKDVFPRFKTMRGYRVDRKGGWDCHGLPVELEVEKELGLNSKREIEAYGVEAFNRRCRESVLRYVDAWEELTERVGFWVDTAAAYRTMDTAYVESVWWALAELYRRGLLVEDDKVVPYCPRCETPLSDAEVAQGYRETDDPSIYVRFPVLTGPLAAEGADLLIWTTMPWTLIPNTLAVVSDQLRYVLARGGRAGDRPVVLAANRLEAALGKGAEVVREVALGELVGARYRPPFNFVGPGSPDDPEGDPASWRYVVTGDFVRADEGTGIVHTGAAFGEDDLRVARAHGAPVVKPVTPQGRFDERAGPYAGMPIREADARIIEDLRAAGLLVHAGTYRHTFPFCWRCGTALFYFALTSWYARTTAVKDRLLAENARVNWKPEHIREGRFGDWLANNVDWSLSRSRYWGTPLPLWRCPQGHVTAVESLADLSRRAGRDLSGLDPHRPYVDAVTFACPDCGAEARRVPEVLDAWFDSGAMPFAQWGYPHAPGSRERLERSYPADFISEGIDQTRGWFYSLLAEGVMLFGAAPYRNVVCLGHIVDRHGRKMSKSLGNVLDPFELLDRYGADPLRWFMLASGSPWAPRRISHEVLQEITRGFFLTLWNTYHFFTLYARLEGFDPNQPARGEPTPLDRWVLSELARTVREVTEQLDAYDPAGAARRLAGFVDDLSNWYVRLSRRRFWRGAQGSDAAYRTLWTCLKTLALLLAPYTPFVAEALWQGLVVAVDPQAPDSVHLASWPEPAAGAWDPALAAAMAEVRRLVGLGRQARTEAKVRVRQPLARALVTVPAGLQDGVAPLLDLVAAELNVKAVSFAEGEHLTEARLVPNFRALGPRFGPRTQAVAAAVRALAGEAAAGAAARLRAGERFALEVPGAGSVELGPEEVGVAEAPVTGWRVVRDGATSVALDLHVTPELAREGLARELVRAVQDLRKAAGLAVEDRIELAVEAAGEVAAAVREHRDYLMGETLAVALHAGPLAGGRSAEVRLDGEPARLWLRRAEP